MNVSDALASLRRVRTIDGSSRRNMIGVIGAATATVAAGCSSSDGETTASSATADSSTSTTSPALNRVTTTEGNASIATTAAPPGTVSSTATTIAGGRLELAILTPGNGAKFCGVAREPRGISGCEIQGPDVSFDGIVTEGAEVFANDFPAVVTGNTWTIRIRLFEGTMPVLVTARDADGTETVASVIVSYAEFEPSDF